MKIMFENAGLRYCYEESSKVYLIITADGIIEMSFRNALEAWTYYIQRIDMIVRKRILEAARRKRHSETIGGDHFGEESPDSSGNV